MTAALLLAGFLAAGCVPEDKRVDPVDTGLEPTEAGDDMAGAEATQVMGDGTVWTADTIDPAGDRDFFFVELPVGQMAFFFTLAYAATGQGTPDTVILVYDSAGNLVTENDDMPCRFWETDSAVTWQVTDPGGYYVEVRDWSDWSAESNGAAGGPDYVYELFGYTAPLSEDLDEGLMSGEMGTWMMPGTPDVPVSESALIAYGEIGSAGDVDWYAVDLPEDSFWGWSFWPYDMGNLAPLVTVYDAAGEVVGQSADPVYTPTSFYFYDAGVLVYVAEAGTYYVSVEDTNGGGGEAAGFFYPMYLIGWSGGLAWEEEPNDTPEEPGSLALTDSGDGYWYKYWTGALDDASDGADVFVIEADQVGGFAGNELQFSLATSYFGSLLDARVTVRQDDGTGVLVDLATATVDPDGTSPDDPEVVDVALTSDGDLYLYVEHEDPLDAGARSHFYYAVALVY